MSVALPELPVHGGAAGAGVAARRAVIRWAWRLFRREWRQHVLIVALLAVAVAATIFGAAVAYNAPSSVRAATFGTADNVLTLTGDDPHVPAAIASVKRRFGPVEVIENQTISVPGSVDTVQVRDQDPHGRFGHPTLSLVSGRYPGGAGEVAVTGGVASLFNLRIGGVWREGGRARRVVGVVENPANLLDQFALVAPGQLSAPTQVTVLFDAVRHRCASITCAGPLRFPGGATAQHWTSTNNGMGATTLVLVVAVFGLVFIGLVGVAGFTVMAQRRLRMLGMLGALGATDRNVSLVMIVDGAVVGVVATVIGAAVGFGAWLAYAPQLQASVEHRVAWSHVPLGVVAAAIAVAVLTAIAAAWRSARAAARMPIVASLSGRPAAAKASHRLAAAGAALLAGGLWFLWSAGGWNVITHRHDVPGHQVLGSAGGFAGWTSGWTAAVDTHSVHFLFAGIVATAIGALLLAPLAVAAPTIGARRAPIAVRLALRDLGRYRARSGAVLAAVTFAVLVAVSICILTTADASDPFSLSGPNLAPNQLVVYVPHGRVGSGPLGSGPPPSPARQRALEEDVNALAAAVRARFIQPLDSAGRLDPGANTPESGTNQRAELWRAGSPGEQFQSPLYVATPALLRNYGIDPGEIDPDADILTSRAGLADSPHLVLYGQGDVFTSHNAAGHELPGSFHAACPPASCIANPKVQTIHDLPTGTSTPSTVITEDAMRKLGQRLVPDGWLIQTSEPLTAEQKNVARETALTAKTRIEVSSGEPNLTTVRDGATAVGILLALAVLAMTVGLIRSETAGDLRTLTAAGATGTTRRALAAATAGALGLTGALLGTTFAYLAVMAWAHSDLAASVGHVPVGDLIAILLGMPLVAAITGWLLAGRQPPLITRQPLE